jgi:hypothetical protein
MIRAFAACLFALGWAGAAGADEPARSMPDALTRDFAHAEHSIAQFDSCPDTLALANSDELLALARRLDAMVEQASEVWGHFEAAELAVTPAARPIRCRADNWSNLVRMTSERLDTLTASLEAALTPMQTGAWLGSMSLCATGPLQARVGKNDYDDRPTLSITLNAAAAGRLAAITRANVGYSLALRIDGQVVVQPMINEPIEGGELLVSGGEREEYDQLAESLRQCGSSPQDAAAAN